MARKNKFKSGELVAYGTFNTEYLIIVEVRFFKYEKKSVYKSISYKCLFPNSSIDSIGESSLTKIK